MYQLASQSGEVTRLALGKRILAEIAIAEEDYEQAEAELACRTTDCRVAGVVDSSTDPLSQRGARRDYA